MRELLEQRQAAQSADGDGYEAKHARAMEKIDNAMSGRISAVRVVGPALPQMSEVHRVFLRRNFGNDMVVGQCRFCNPPDREYECPGCNWKTVDRWRMKVHNLSNSELCRAMIDKKARNWARRA